MDERWPPLMALDFDLGVDAVILDWEIETRRDANPDGNQSRVSLSPEEAWAAL